MQVERAKACAQADRAGRYLSLNNAMHLSNSPIKCDKAIILIKCFNMHSLSDHLSSKHGVQEEDVPHQCKFSSVLGELATWHRVLIKWIDMTHYARNINQLTYIAITIYIYANNNDSKLSRSTWSTSSRSIQTDEQFVVSLSSPWASSLTL